MLNIYSVKLDTSNLTDKNVNIKFYKNEAHTQAWTDIDEETAAINATVETGKIYWVWEEDNTKLDNGNGKDTQAGIDAKTDLKFTVTLTASQVINSPVTGG